MKIPAISGEHFLTNAMNFVNYRVLDHVISPLSSIGVQIAGDSKPRSRQW
jgi:hypothetical protein